MTTTIDLDTTIYLPALHTSTRQVDLDTIENYLRYDHDGLYDRLADIDPDITDSMDTPDFEEILDALQDAGYDPLWLVQHIFDDPNANIFDPDDGFYGANRDLYQAIEDFRDDAIRAEYEADNDWDPGIPLKDVLMLAPGLNWFADGGVLWLGSPDENWVVGIDADDTVCVFAAGEEVATTTIPGASKLGPKPAKRVK